MIFYVKAAQKRGRLAREHEREDTKFTFSHFHLIKQGTIQSLFYNTNEGVLKLTSEMIQKFILSSPCTCNAYRLMYCTQRGVNILRLFRSNQHYILFSVAHQSGCSLDCGCCSSDPGSIILFYCLQYSCIWHPKAGQ